METLKVKEIKKLSEIPTESILVCYSDHYKYNSGDDIYFIDKNGNSVYNPEMFKELKWHDEIDDRGLISVHAITSINGGLACLIEFKHICQRYVKKSQNIKDWDNGRMVYGVMGGLTKETYANEGSRDDSFSGMKDSCKFEDSTWYIRCYKRSKESTIEKKRKLFYDEQIKRNETIRNAMIRDKEEAAKWFNDNNISVRVAYLMVNCY
jgi:hypothetical protein